VAGLNLIVMAFVRREPFVMLFIVEPEKSFDITVMELEEAVKRRVTVYSIPTTSRKP
jgi:hypothetical protein